MLKKNRRNLMMLLMMIVLLTMRTMRRMRLMRKRMAKKKKKRNKRKKKHDANADDDGEEWRWWWWWWGGAFESDAWERVPKRCLKTRSEARPLPVMKWVCGLIMHIYMLEKTLIDRNEEIYFQEKWLSAKECYLLKRNTLFAWGMLHPVNESVCL